MPSRPSFPYLNLVWEMTRGEIKLRDQGTALGFLWTLLHPGLMFAVLYGLFAKWVGRMVDSYILYLLVGLVLWNFFQKATTYALGSFRRFRGTVLNYRFPREIVVLASIGAVLWSSLMELCVLMAVVIALGQPPRAAWLLLPMLLTLEIILVIGLGLFLAVWSVEYQDLERIWDVTTSALFYLTPIFYPLEIISADKQFLLRLNPLTRIIAAFRDCIVLGRAPNAAVCLLLLAGGLALCVAGVALLRRRQYALADKLLV
ncbi:MAG: ABC transporter permease [Elusimicrobiota bacterium]